MIITLVNDDKVIKELMEKIKIVQDKPEVINLRCIESRQPDFTVGKIYCMEPIDGAPGIYFLRDDAGFYWHFFSTMLIDGYYQHEKGDFDVI